MIRIAAILPVLFGLSSCGNESVPGYGDAGKTWNLAELDAAPFIARATLTFPEQGRIAGEAPCNRYSGAQTAPYPRFRAEKIAATRRACPELATETVFFSVLEAMTVAEMAGDMLILRNDDGHKMVFRATGPTE